MAELKTTDSAVGVILDKLADLAAENMMLKVALEKAKEEGETWWSQYRALKKATETEGVATS